MVHGSGSPSLALKLVRGRKSLRDVSDLPPSSAPRAASKRSSSQPWIVSFNLHPARQRTVADPC
jgi:hypothetical protein